MPNTLRIPMHAQEHIETRPEPAADHETMIADDRAGLRPSEHVQSKLLSMLRSATVPVSCLHSRREVRRAVAAV